MSPRAKDPLAAMRKRFVALGYDDAEMIEQMKDPVFRAAFNAPRKLYGNAPPSDAVRLYARTELPPWVKPVPESRGQWSAFFGHANIPTSIKQAIFAITEDGAEFCDLHGFAEGMIRDTLAPGAQTSLPGCVLIAVGVEQIRRARARR